jgi:hypothetical protein
MKKKEIFNNRIVIIFYFCEKYEDSPPHKTEYRLNYKKDGKTKNFYRRRRPEYM